MICITSISPKHYNNEIQFKAIKSWVDSGFTVVSMNSPEEVKLLEKFYQDVKFVKTHRTLEKTYGRPLVSINALMDFAKEQNDPHICLVNSDIEIFLSGTQIDSIIEKMNDTVLISNRLDYDDNYTGVKYKAGFDVFFIHQKYLGFFPQSMHAMGMTFWDYWVPYTATKAFINVQIIQDLFAFHKKHPFQYHHDHWQQSGQFFLWQSRLYQFSDTNEIGKMSDFVFKYIYKACKPIKL